MRFGLCSSFFWRIFVCYFLSTSLQANCMRDVVVLVDVDRLIALIPKQFITVIASIASVLEDLEELVDVTATAIVVVHHHGNAPTTKSAIMQDVLAQETIFYSLARTFMYNLKH